jgi:hypothetical protein
MMSSTLQRHATLFFIDKTLVVVAMTRSSFLLTVAAVCHLALMATADVRFCY